MTDTDEDSSSKTNESVEIEDLQERAEKLSEQIKELNVRDDNSETSSSSQAEDHDEGTVIEKLSEKEVVDQKDSVGESLEKVNSILIGIDKELGNNNFNMDNNLALKESPASVSGEFILVQTDSDSLKEEKSKKTLSFSLPEKEKSLSSDNDDAEMDDIHSISSEASMTDNIQNLVTNEHIEDIEEQRRKIENKSKKILENYGKISKQKYFDDRDGRKSNEKKTKRIENSTLERFSEENPKLTRTEFSRRSHFWQMPFREKLFHQTMNPTRHQTSDTEDEEDHDASQSPVVPPNQDEMDPKMFAPTGDIYSYFQRRRSQPFPYSSHMTFSIRHSLGGRILKSYVY